MLHHSYKTINGKIDCPSCNEKILEAHPNLQGIWVKIKAAFPDCHISWAFRGEADQNEMFSSGKTRCQWPHSKHNVMKDDGTPYSRAIDLFRISTTSGKAWFLPEYYLKISDFLDSERLPLEWSGNWTSAKDHFVDLDHFELRPDIL